MTHLKYNNMFHPQIFLYEVHAFRPLSVFEGILIVAIEPVHDISLKMLQQVHLGLEIIGILRHGIVLPNVNRPVSSRRNIVEMTTRQTYLDNQVINIYEGKENVLLVWGEHERRAIVEMHAN